MRSLRSPLWLGAVLALAAGCRTATYDTPATVHVGEKARDVALAKVKNISEQIQILEQERAALEKKRADLWRDADAYRNLAAEVWSDPRVLERDRGPLAKQYMAWADERDRQADLCTHRIASIDSRTLTLANQRHDQLRMAANYENLRAPAEQ